MKYNLHYKHKQWITTLALEAETATCQLPLPEQEPIRYQVNKNIQHLFKTNGNHQHTNNYGNNEKRTLLKLKKKLTANTAIIIKADKGNSIVVTYLTSYHDKVQTFISDNNFTKIEIDLPKKYQRDVCTLLNKCPHIIPTTTKWRCVNMKPTSPYIRGLIKIHKPEAPIRPIVNWKNAPAYKLAKKLVQLLTTYLPLP
jgi:hypothetical protein